MTQSPMKAISSMVLALSLAAALTSCAISVPPLKEADVVGTWSLVDDSSHRSTFTFSKDNTFVVDALPSELWTEPSNVDRSAVRNWTKPVSWKGGWDIGVQDTTGTFRAVTLFGDPPSGLRGLSFVAHISTTGARTLTIYFGEASDEIDARDQQLVWAKASR